MAKKTTTEVTPGSLGKGRVRVRIETTKDIKGNTIRQKMVQIPRRSRVIERE